MAHQSSRPRHPAVWVIVAVLLLAPIVGTLWVPFYARTEPKVADFPFFYWYQLMWIPIVGVTSGLAYGLLRATGRRRSGPRDDARPAGADAERPYQAGGGTVQAP